MLLRLPIWVPRNGTSNPEDPYYPKPSPVSEFLLWHIEFLFSFILFRVLFWQFSIFYIILKETGDPTTITTTSTTPGRLLVVAAAHVSRDTCRELRASRDTYSVFAMCIHFQRCNLRLPICQLAKCSSFNPHSLLVGECCNRCTKQCRNPPTPPQKNTFFCSRSCSFWSLVWVGDSHHSLFFFFFFFLLLLTHDTRTVFP